MSGCRGCEPHDPAQVLAELDAAGPPPRPVRTDDQAAWLTRLGERLTACRTCPTQCADGRTRAQRPAARCPADPPRW